MQYMLDTYTVSDLMKTRPEVIERVKATPMGSGRWMAWWCRTGASESQIAAAAG